MGEHEVDPEATGCPDVYIENEGWRFSAEGKGWISKLGKVELTLTQCTLAGPGGIESVGTMELTTVKGHTLKLEHTMRSEMIGEADAPPEGFKGKAKWKAVGGTGWLENAKGFGWMHMVGDIPEGDRVYGLPDGAALMTFVGKIKLGKK
jgi:hypothetical protein